MPGSVTIIYFSLFVSLTFFISALVEPIKSACIKMLGINQNTNNIDGDNSKLLAQIIASTVLASEISLMSALSTNDLIDAHMKLNR